MPDEAEKYDFSDWQLGSDDEETLQGIVRGQLIALQELIQAGYWDFREWDEDLNPLPPHRCVMRWKWGPEIDDPPLLIMRPAQLAAELIKGLQHMAKYGMHSRPGDKDELRDYWQRVTAGWRAALDAVDEEAKRLLDTPPGGASAAG